MKMLTLAGSIALGLCAFAGTAEAAAFIQNPTIVQNPNPAVPLAAVLSFQADEPVATTVEVRQGKRSWTISFGEGKDPSKGLPLVGMRADKEHEFQVTIEGKDGKKVTAPSTLTFRTPKLPDADAPYSMNFPRPVLIKNDLKPEEQGFTVFSLRHEVNVLEAEQYAKARGRYNRFFGMLIGLDDEGEIVWYFKDDFRIAGMTQLANGNFLFNYVDFRTKEVDILGNVVHEWYAADRPFGKPDNAAAIAVDGITTIHHQPHEMPNGNFLGMSAQVKEIDNYYTTEYNADAPRGKQKVMGDRLIEFTKDGKLVWSWETFDHLDPFQIGYELTFPYWINRGFPDTLDWTHGNGCSYDASDDSIIANFRNIDAVIKVDRKTGQIKWILSDPTSWKGENAKKLLKPVGKDFRYPFHGHNPRVIGANEFIMYDNSTYQAKPFDGREIVDFDKFYTRGVVFRVNEKDMTVEQVWASAGEKTPDSASSWAMGDAHQLANGDRFIVDTIMLPVNDPSVSKLITLRKPAPTGKLHADQFPCYSRARIFDGKSNAVKWEVSFRDELGIVSWQTFGGVRIKSFYEGQRH